MAVRLPIVDGSVAGGTSRTPSVDESALPFEHPLYRTLLRAPGLSVATAPLDALLDWGL